MQLGTPMAPYLSESMPPNIEKIFLSWTRVLIVFNHESWLENNNSIPLTPANTTIRGNSVVL